VLLSLGGIALTPDTALGNALSPLGFPLRSRHTVPTFLTQPLPLRDPRTSNHFFNPRTDSCHAKAPAYPSALGNIQPEPQTQRRLFTLREARQPRPREGAFKRLGV
jgi:hypothetical protein